VARWTSPVPTGKSPFGQRQEVYYRKRLPGNQPKNYTVNTHQIKTYNPFKFLENIPEEHSKPFP
jgi:hypothetical protein